MPTRYMDEPLNFAEIRPYVIVDKKQIAVDLITAERCYFYDTCTFQKHMQMLHPEYIFQYLRRQNGLVVIIRGILMEMPICNGDLAPECVAYIRGMHDAGLKVLVLYEEDLFDVLNLFFTTNDIINDCLSYAVKTVKRPTSTIESTLNSDSALCRELMGGNVANSKLYARFFQAVRKNKVSGDNLGEELIAICVHLLANLPEKNDYKYLVMTDDKGAIGLVNVTFKNVLDHRRVKAFSALSTARLAQELFKVGIISQKSQVEEVLSGNNTNTVVRILGSEEYDLEPKIKSMTSSELADKIITPGMIHINY